MGRVLIAAEAWETLEREVRAAYPQEVALYPLGALVPDAAASPLEQLRWEDAGDLVLTHALVPLAAARDSGPAHIRFAHELADEAAADLKARADVLCARHPRLSFLTKIHSHPFVGGAFLSRGDLVHNVLHPAAWRWWAQRGLAEALMLVARPLGESGPVGPDDEESEPPQDWTVACFRVSPGGQVTRMEDAQRIEPDDERLQRALAPPYWRTAAGSAWCDANKHMLRAQGLQPSRNLLMRGWRRVLLRGAGPARVLCLPPDLPAAPARLLSIEDAARDRFALLRVLPTAESFDELPLEEALR